MREGSPAYCHSEGSRKKKCAVLLRWRNLHNPKAYARGHFKPNRGGTLLPRRAEIGRGTSKHYPGKHGRVHASEDLRRKYGQVYHCRYWAPIRGVLQ